MSDSSKSCLSIIFFTSAFLLPMLGFAGGWAIWDLKTGTEIALIIFGFFFLAAIITLLLVKRPSWLIICLPFVVGFLYTIIPDPLLGPFDDTLMMLIGSVLTFILWKKRQPRVSNWIILPLLGVAAYELIGGFIPGPFDEIVITFIAVGIVLYITCATHQDSEKNSYASADDYIDPDQESPQEQPLSTKEDKL